MSTSQTRFIGQGQPIPSTHREDQRWLRERVEKDPRFAEQTEGFAGWGHLSKAAIDKRHHLRLEGEEAARAARPCRGGQLAESPESSGSLP